MKMTVIVDASFCPKTRAGAWAVWINGDAGRVQKSGTFRKLAENATEAEWMAAANGLAIAQQLGARDVLLQTDNLHLVEGGNVRKAKLHGYAKMLGLTISVRHVKSHVTEDDANAAEYCHNWCDRAAYREMVKQRKTLPEWTASLTRKMKDGL
jgi:ribonuclease HI